MPIKIAAPSVQSLFLEMRFSGQKVATGTGFLADSKIGTVLITNRHNVSGRHPQTGKCLSATGSVPDEVVIMHNQKGLLGNWKPVLEPLVNENDMPLWHEHPILKEKGDFVALPLTQTEGIECYKYSLENNGPDIMVGPSDYVSVVGFPFGMNAGGALAIWATGFLASELDIDQWGMPIVLIDCRARPGQSGSAVIAYRSSGMVPMRGGGAAAFPGPVTKLIGIYSGRVNPESDLGIVWKTSALKELVDSIS